MSQNRSAHSYTFVNQSGSVRITYDPSVPASLAGAQRSSGPRLEYHGSERDLIFPRNSDGPTQVTIQQDSPLISVILKPTIDAISVTLTLLLPRSLWRGKNRWNFRPWPSRAQAMVCSPGRGRD